MLRIVADLGNSRLKLGRVDARGQLGPVVGLTTDNPTEWASAWHKWNPTRQEPSSWAISSVNPPAAERLETFLANLGEIRTTWFRSAAEVPFKKELTNPETAGADRSLAVKAAISARNQRGPGLVVLCGTAVTVERVAADGTWQGGAIAPGLGLTAKALHTLTAQLPLIPHRAAPPAWGKTTVTALEAGIFWGVVGAIRELLTRQSIGLDPKPWIVWTGGDAEALASAVAWENAEIINDLVLLGLADTVFGNIGERV